MFEDYFIHGKPVAVLDLMEKYSYCRPKDGNSIAEHEWRVFAALGASSQGYRCRDYLLALQDEVLKKCIKKQRTSSK